MDNVQANIFDGLGKLHEIAREIAKHSGSIADRMSGSIPCGADPALEKVPDNSAIGRLEIIGRTLSRALDDIRRADNSLGFNTQQQSLGVTAQAANGRY